jgi:hypothetical protein
MTMLPLTDSDKRARCLCGMPLQLKEILIYPIKVKQVVEIGEQQYMYYLSLITNFKKLFETIVDEKDNKDKIQELRKAEDFDFLIIILSFNDDFKDLFCEAVSFFLEGRKIEFNKENGEFIIEGYKLVIKEKEYKELINIIKMQNYLLKKPEEEEKPSNKKARELLEKKAKVKAKLEKAKAKSGQMLNFVDYISVVNSKSLNMNIDKCLGMTVYAFFDYLERLALIDSYDTGIKQIMAGAKPNEVQLKHWLSKL